AGLPGLCEALKPFLVGEGTDYSAVAKELGLLPPAVRVAVHRLRKRFCAVIREEIGQTVAGPSDVDSEILWLLTSVRGGAYSGDVAGSTGSGILPAMRHPPRCSRVDRRPVLGLPAAPRPFGNRRGAGGTP